MRGIVADIKGKYAVILTKDGMFKRIKALPGMTVGAEADLVRPSSAGSSRKLAFKITSIAASCLLALGIGYGAYSYTVPYGYIDLDINPSVELAVNIYDRIIGAEALNEDGGRLLQGSGIKHMKLDSGLMQLMNRAVEQGYLKVRTEDTTTDAADDANVDAMDTSTGTDMPTVSDKSQSMHETDPGKPDSIDTPDETTMPDSVTSATQTDSHEGNEAKIENAVLFTVSSGNAKKSSSLLKEVEGAASKKLEKERVDTKILVGEASLEQRDAARKLGVTPGKLALIENAIKYFPEIELEDIKNTAVKDLIGMARHRWDEDGTEKNENEGRQTDEKEPQNQTNNGKDNNNRIGSDKDKENGKDNEKDKEKEKDKDKDKDKDTENDKGNGNDTNTSEYGNKIINWNKGGSGNASGGKDTGPGKNTPDDNNTADKGNEKNSEQQGRPNDNKNSDDSSNRYENSSQGFNKNERDNKSDSRKTINDVKEALQKYGEELKKQSERLREELLKQLSNNRNNNKKDDNDSRNGRQKDDRSNRNKSNRNAGSRK